MQNEWLTLTVQQLQDDAIILVEDGNHGEYRPRPDEFNSHGVAFIRASDMDSGRILFSTSSRINDTAVARIRKGIGKAGDILLSHKGTVGKLAVAPDDCEPFVCSPQTTFWRVLNPAKLDRRFLYFFMRSQAFREQLDSIKGETDMADYASLTAQRRFRLPIVNIRLQKSIATVLGALDDKIELNRRMSETLELMARAIFKDWFVDFGPTHAKMEGRAPYLGSDLWSLFPDRFDDGKPEGWSLRSFRDLSDILSGGTPSKASLAMWNGTIPWISPKVMTSVHVFDSEDRVTPFAIGNGTRIAPNGSTLLMVRGMGLHQGVRISQARRDVAFNQDVKAFVPKDVEPSFLLFALLNVASSLFERVESSGHGTGKLPSEIIDSFKVATPPRATRGPLVAHIDVLNERMAANATETDTLSALRDLLLPRLMSGEIRIKDAEKMVGEAA